MFMVGEEPIYRTERGSFINHLQDGCAGDIRIEAHRTKGCWTPEKALYAAVLLSAKEEYAMFKKFGPNVRAFRLGARERAGKIVADIEAWMDGARATIPFQSCCDVLGLDPSAVKRTFQERSTDVNTA